MVEPDQSGTTVIHVHTWPVIRFMFSPGYRSWHSPWGWGYYPKYWKPWRRIPVATYRVRTVRWTKHATFRVTRTRRVKRSHVYKPRSSKRAVAKTRPPAAKLKVPAKATAAKPGKQPVNRQKSQGKPQIKQAPKKQRQKAPAKQPAKKSGR